ncbi:MAG: hypothetical protein V1720_07040 [bacterium]
METCWFCKKNPSANHSAQVVNLYKINEVRTTITPASLIGLGVKQTNYTSQTIKIPRCESCKIQHYKNSKKATRYLANSFILGFISLAVGIGTGILINILFPRVEAWICVLSGIVVGYIAGRIINKFTKLKYNYSPDAKQLGYDQYTPINNLISKGWKIGEKPIY